MGRELMAAAMITYVDRQLKAGRMEYAKSVARSSQRGGAEGPQASANASAERAQARSNSASKA